MTFDELISGLKQRGFEDTEGIMGRGKCHLNRKHFVLFTDGLVIYSTEPHWDAHNSLSDDWPLDEFSFEALDRLI